MDGEVKWASGAWVAGALAVIAATGLATGWLLKHYDENIGFRSESRRIAEVLRIASGMMVGDVRAGTGKWTVELARRVGRSGQVFATAGPDPPHEIYETLAEAGVDNVSVITKTPGDTGRLPVGCCDAILVRAVYHHLTERPDFAWRLFGYVKPNGRIAVIDFDEGTPEHASGHGISRNVILDEMTEAGFEVEEVIDEWAGNAFCIVFRKPGRAVSTAPKAVSRVPRRPPRRLDSRASWGPPARSP